MWWVMAFPLEFIRVISQVFKESDGVLGYATNVEQFSSFDSSSICT